ncbi:hypothetical protein [Saccharothrix obliqua]|uniref:pPIWI_RE_Z domain-containing protein n=1 Tax=Saccharothrix obliqua TaxID=2861747 RepID=UPI001C5E03EC|nr:hypothetical protein [Saccharothrix obliqua]MBW4720344.1 hypothetical protein [Saccharothrix obliqua]
MRDSAKLFGALSEQLTAGYDVSVDTLHKMFTTEFGLFLARALLPGHAAGDAWALFSGYPIARERGLISAETDDVLRVARYELWTLREPGAWKAALDDYNDVPAELRGYHEVAFDRPPQRRAVSAAAERWSIYEGLTRRSAPFKRRTLPIARPGRHTFISAQELRTVRLPKVDLPAPVGHDLDAPLRGEGAPLWVDKADLLRTARLMDDVENAAWAARLDRTTLLVREGRDFTDGKPLEVRGLTHLLGIVGAGKSTLRDVLTVHAVRELGLRVTLVVGDVAEVLKLTKLFQRHGLRAAPVVGNWTRPRHAERLHRRLAGRGMTGLLAHVDNAFDHLGTACAVDALHDIDEPPIPYVDAPCSRLRPADRRRDASGRASGEMRRACPFWSACPRHHSARELVDADVWLATPQSLLLTSVPSPQNTEHVRFLELACRRSDLVVVDEADRVQIALDTAFAPTETLVGRGSASWLDRVHSHKIEQLVGRGRLQLSDRDVQAWSAAVNTAGAAADRLYALLIRRHDLRRWLREGHFSAWLLQRKMALDRYPTAPEGVDDPFESRRAEVLDELDRFRDNPFGERRNFPPADPVLVRLTSELLHATSLRRTRLELREVLARLLDVQDRGTGREWLDTWSTRFEFTLLLAALEPKLALVTVMWPRVESALSLEAAGWFRRPEDYGPVVPEPPMGAVIGFQFHTHGVDNGGVVSGDLRFFHCDGVGRALFQAMPVLPAVDGRPGPNVVLMSGSSWAGSSTRYHIDTPVTAVLAPPQRETDRIAAESEFRFTPVRDGDRWLRVSGSALEDRARLLVRMANELATGSDDEPSAFEEELADIADDDRRHILVLVGSYEECAVVADALQATSRWRDKVLRLVADDDDVPSDLGDHQARVLRRGDVDTLAGTGAELLVAPLLAVERGHNILNDQRYAAIGSVYFLVRPNPRPDDLALAVHAVNDWASRVMADGRFRTWATTAPSLDSAGRDFRRAARDEWRRVLGRSNAWQRLGVDRRSVTWDLLVVIWQVIGRLVRGGVPARVNFVDAAFAPNLVEGRADTAETSLLVAMHELLDEFCSPKPGTGAPDGERRLVRALYGPLWAALARCLADASKGTHTS